MSRVEVHADRVVVKLTGKEKALAWRRRDIVIDRALITSVLITEDPWVWLRGVRTTGTSMPGRHAHGTWRHLAGRDFALMRRGVSAVVIDLETPEETEEGAADVGADADAGASRAAFDGQTEFDELARVILSTSYASELIEVLRLENDPQEVFTTDTGA